MRVSNLLRGTLAPRSWLNPRTHLWNLAHAQWTSPFLHKLKFILYLAVCKYGRSWATWHLISTYRVFLREIQRVSLFQIDTKSNWVDTCWLGFSRTDFWLTVTVSMLSMLHGCFRLRLMTRRLSNRPTPTSLISRPNLDLSIYTLWWRFDQILSINWCY